MITTSNEITTHETTLAMHLTLNLTKLLGHEG
jgi:hypothetical protein